MPMPRGFYLGHGPYTYRKRKEARSVEIPAEKPYGLSLPVALALTIADISESSEKLLLT